MGYTWSSQREELSAASSRKIPYPLPTFAGAAGSGTTRSAPATSITGEVVVAGGAWEIPGRSRRVLARGALSHRVVHLFQAGGDGVGRVHEALGERGMSAATRSKSLFPILLASFQS